MSLFSYAFLLLPFMNTPAELKIKSEEVKISWHEIAKDHKGTFSGFEATILFDANDLTNSTISGKVDASTINTENAKRDEHLKSADFFEVKKYPEISFKSTSIAASENGFVMKGLMNIKGTEHEETITFGFQDNIFSGTSTIQMSNYPIGSYPSKKPSDTEVKISFHVPVG
ncbi:MAG: YceI family protein [Crocinitomicaceae bacterium]|nr:YceI family protein [Crocinitomicaceae bacterium]